MVHEQQRQRPVDRRVDARCVDEHLESPRGGHERAVDAEVVARRAAEAGGVPGVVEGDLAARHEQHARHGVAVRIESLAITVVDRALRREPVGVTAAARERPAAADRVALGRVGRRGRAADRSRGAGDDAPLAPDRAHVVFGQVAAEGVVLGGDHHAPAGRAVGLRHLLHDARRGHRIGGRALRDRHEQLEQSGRAQLLDEVGRQPALLLDLGGPLADTRSQGARCQQRGRARRAPIVDHDHHASRLSRSLRGCPRRGKQRARCCACSVRAARRTW